MLAPDDPAVAAPAERAAWDAALAEAAQAAADALCPLMAAGGRRGANALEVAMAMCMQAPDDGSWPRLRSGAGAAAFAGALAAPARAGAVAATLAAALRAEQTPRERLFHLPAARKFLRCDDGVSAEACRPELAQALLAFVGRLGRGVGGAGDEERGFMVAAYAFAAEMLQALAACDMWSQDPEGGALIAAAPGAAAALVSALRSALALAVAGEEKERALLASLCLATGFAGVCCRCEAAEARGGPECAAWCGGGSGGGSKSRARLVESLRRLGAAALLEQVLRQPWLDVKGRAAAALTSAVPVYRSPPADQEGVLPPQQAWAPAPGTQALRQLFLFALADGVMGVMWLPPCHYALCCCDLAAVPQLLAKCARAALSGGGPWHAGLGLLARGMGAVWGAAVGGGAASGGASGECSDFTPSPSIAILFNFDLCPCEQLLKRLHSCAAAAAAGGNALAAAAEHEAAAALRVCRAIKQEEQKQQQQQQQQQQEEKEEERQHTLEAQAAASPAVASGSGAAVHEQRKQPHVPASSDGEVPRACAACDKAEGGEGVRLRRCRGCFAVSFCSDECYLAFWPMHRPLCKQEQARRAAQSQAPPQQQQTQKTQTQQE